MNDRSIMLQLIARLSELVVALKKQLEQQVTAREQIFNTAVNSLGKDMAPIHNEFGCAEAVNAVVQKAIGRPVGGDVSTYRMIRALKSNPLRFLAISISEAQPGDIIISPTGYGSGRISNGHVGIFFDKSTIMSNTSSNGLWEKNYTVSNWFKRYRTEGGYPVYVYRVIS